MDLVGDFNGLYASTDDPWGQVEGGLKYVISRQTQRSIIERNVTSGILLDVGCGLGVSTNLFASVLSSIGLDISLVAIQKAKNRYPGIKFYCGDIVGDLPSQIGHGVYDILVINQMLWYIIDQFPKALENSRKVLKKNGFLLISCFVFDKRDQHFARNHFQGHIDILSWLERICFENNFSIAEYHCERIDVKYFDFHALLQKAK